MARTYLIPLTRDNPDFAGTCPKYIGDMIGADANFLGGVRDVNGQVICNWYVVCIQMPNYAALESHLDVIRLDDEKFTPAKLTALQAIGIDTSNFGILSADNREKAILKKIAGRERTFSEAGILFQVT